MAKQTTTVSPVGKPGTREGVTPVQQPTRPPKK
jgi:hypothetical protein